MASNILTDKAILAALKRAASDGKPSTISDGDGLTLIARPDGAGWWRLRYWIDSRENRLSLGTYPETGLRDARAKRDEARKLIAAGTDPSSARKASKAAKAAKVKAEQLAAAGKPMPGSFEFVAREWLAQQHQHNVTAGHADRTRIRLEQEVFPWLGLRPMVEIEAPELLACLRRVEARGAIETAHRVHAACGQVFRYGIGCGFCSRNPAADLKGQLRPVNGRHLAAIVDPAGAAELLRAMVDYKGHPVTRAALALSALLFLRPGELRQMEWAHVDLDEALVTLPPALMKRRKEGKANGPPHLVPLAPQAVAILRELQGLTGTKRYVFPSLLTGERPMSENTVRSALRRMGYGNDDMTAHGFRAMARTMLDERLGIAPEVIEAQLAHTVGDALGRAYNRTQFLAQRRQMMTAWADYLDKLRAGGKVLDFNAPAGAAPAAN